MKDSISQARTARSLAHAQRKATAQALERARRITQAATEHARELELKLAQTETEQAIALAEQIASGPTGELPISMDQKVVAALSLARFDLSIKTRALKSLTTTHARAQAAATAAEASVIAAVDRIFLDEDTALEKQLVHHLDQAFVLGKRLFGIAVNNEMNRHGGLFSATLARLDRAILDRHHLAVNFMREGDPAAAAARSLRRESMIRGVIPVEEVSAA
jgi:hypothetical protein